MKSLFDNNTAMLQSMVEVTLQTICETHDVELPSFLFLPPLSGALHPISKWAPDSVDKHNISALHFPFFPYGRFHTHTRHILQVLSQTHFTLNNL